MIVAFTIVGLLAWHTGGKFPVIGTLNLTPAGTGHGGQGEAVTATRDTGGAVTMRGPAGPVTSMPGNANEQLADRIARKAGWSRHQIDCMDVQLTYESAHTWDPHVPNGAGSGAYGIVQALPAGKMAAAGADWADNPATQLRWYIRHYIPDRYGTACKAWAFEVANNYY